MRQTLLLLTTACVLSAGTALAQTPPPPDPTPPTANDQPGGIEQPGGGTSDDSPPPADPTPPTPLPGLEEPTEPPAPPESSNDDADRGPDGGPQMDRGPGAEMHRGGHHPMPRHGRAMHHGMYGSKNEEGASLRMRVRGMQIEVKCGADPIEVCVEAIEPLLDKAMAMPRGPREIERRGDREERRGEERDRERHDDDRRDDERRDWDERERDDRDRDDWN